jgi:DNA-binding IclR family transcriptional regulator
MAGTATRRTRFLSLITAPSYRGQSSSVRIKRPGERRSLSRSATRALDLMELFGEARRPLRAVEIARALAMHPSTTNQLLKTMVDSAHLVFDARSKCYQPSPRLAEFAGWMTEIYGGHGHLRELVRDVRTRTGMVATLTTANDLFMQIIDLAVPEGQGGERGLRVSVFGSAIGSAYLAMLADDEVARLADRARIAAADIPAILEAVARIRSDGYADGAIADGSIWSIAMPLPLRGDGVPTVLGLAGPPERVRPELARLCRIMREAIARLV